MRVKKASNANPIEILCSWVAGMLFTYKAKASGSICEDKQNKGNLITYFSNLAERLLFFWGSLVTQCVINASRVSLI